MACTEGSQRPRHEPGLLGTCYEECLCGDREGEGCEFYGGACATFVCDAARPMQEEPALLLSLLRRVPGEDRCVQDACGGDAWVDAPPAHTCVRRCRCPEGGGACALDEACDPATLVCRPGYELRSLAGRQRPECVPVAGGGDGSACRQGSLKVGLCLIGLL